AKGQSGLGAARRRPEPTPARNNPSASAGTGPRRAISSDPGTAASANSSEGSPVRTPTWVSDRFRSAWIAGSTGGTASTVARNPAPASQSNVSGNRTRRTETPPPRRNPTGLGLAAIFRRRLEPDRRSPRPTFYREPAHQEGCNGSFEGDVRQRASHGDLLLRHGRNAGGLCALCPVASSARSRIRAAAPDHRAGVIRRATLSPRARLVAAAERRFHLAADFHG